VQRAPLKKPSRIPPPSSVKTWRSTD